MNACRPPVSSCSARPQHVVDALLHRLDVSVEHRHVRAHAESMREPVNRQIPIEPHLSSQIFFRTRSAKISRRRRAASRGRLLKLAQDLLVALP
jgi:hypothetical protein